MTPRIFATAKPTTRFGRLDIARRNGSPAHEAFTGRVTASLLAQHGSYEAARAYLNNRTVGELCALVAREVGERA